jgi:hypothetical protein
MNTQPNKPTDSTITLLRWDFELLEQVARQRGLDPEQLGAAVGLVLREWLELQEELPCARFP